MTDKTAARIAELSKKLRGAFTPCGDIRIFSAPGRTELGGNHTDHQHGHVLAAAVDIDAMAAVCAREDSRVVIYSDAYPSIDVDISDLAPHADERGSSEALVRGVAAYLSEHGCAVGGFSAYSENLVPGGSGLSSSAAFEVLIGTVFSGLYNGGAIDAVTVARAGQFAENNYYGKPCGLMDQAASAVGGVMAIDFADPAAPVIRKISADFAEFGYALCIIDVGADHAELSGEYAAITEEMGAVARILGGEVLGDAPRGEFFARIPELKGKVSDRAILRAMHFYDDDLRAALEAEALERRDFGEFLRLVGESGRSSSLLLQNIYPAGSTEQSAALALEWCSRILAGEGACRIHGGGFGGTIQAFVPAARTEQFRREMERLTGEGSCRVLNIRALGGTEIVR